MRARSSRFFTITAGSIAAMLAFSASAATRYVSRDGGNIAPYDSWAHAATSIHTAVAAASSGDTVLVSNGTYAVATPVIVDKAISIASLAGAAATIVDGQNLTRGFTMTNAAACVRGFKIVRGNAGGDYGGGIKSYPGGTIEDCIAERCTAAFGGGFYIRDGGTIRSCLAFSNTCVQIGGGIRAYNTNVIDNCTIIGNSAGVNGGGLGVQDVLIRNTIIRGNSAPVGPNYTNAGTVTYSACCATPAPAGAGNIDVDPLFINAGAGNFRLLATSPCANVGAGLAWMAGASDLAGTDRNLGTAADIGAYEVEPASISVTAAPNLKTTEAGGTASFDVVLTVRPSADVTIPISSGNPSEGTADPASITFTPADWNVPRTVTLTGVDDAIDDGNIAFTIATAAAISADEYYNGLDAGDVTASNVDDDTADIAVSPASGTTTTEAGGSVSFSVCLTSQPTDSVIISVRSSDDSEGTPSASYLMFTTANWNVPQTVTVTGVDDPICDHAVSYAIEIAVMWSFDANYFDKRAADVNLTNSDNDIAQVLIQPTSAPRTTEDGGTATFTVQLSSEPVANVTISLASDNPGEGVVPPAPLTFTAANWNVPQTVTATGINDDADDGDVTYTVAAAATSADPGYNMPDAASVQLTNIDNDIAAITVARTTPPMTTELGSTAGFTVALATKPTANVTVNLASSDTTEGVVDPASLTFTPANWNVPQAVNVTGIDDAVADDDITYTVIATASSGDATYNGRSAPDVWFTNYDNDSAGFTVTPLASQTTTEAGGNAPLRVQLTSEPTADVTINLESSDTTEGTVAPASLTFTPANWSSPQLVTVTGADDATDDGDIGYTITSTAASSDPKYNGRVGTGVAFTNEDNDEAGITVVPPLSGTTTEAGGTAVFSVALRSQPAADVTIGLESSNPAEGAIAVASLTFTAANWNAPQAVTVTGVNDDVDDGDIAYSIITAAATSTDPLYEGVDSADVPLSNVDDDTAGIHVTPTSGLVTTEAGGTASFTVVLTSRPLADVTLGLASDNTAEGVPSAASVTFTAANWNTPQNVTVTGVDEAIDDGNAAYNIQTSVAASADPKYDGLNADDVALTNVNNDTAGITVTPTSGLLTTEAAGSATFTVKLDSQPTADVTIGLASSDASEGAVVPASLTFTAANWNTPQTVTVTGADDVLNDGDIAYTIQTESATSADPKYNGMDAADVSVTNQDVPLVDIAVIKGTSTPRPVEGETITYTIHASNAGPHPATGVAITDVLPSGVTYAGKTASQGAYDEGSGLWSVGAIAAGNDATLQIQATVNPGTAGGADIVNVARVTAVVEEESSVANNEASALIHVPLADLAVGMIVDNPRPTEGQQVIFTVAVTNEGDDAASGVKLADLLPAGLTFAGASASQGTFNDGTGEWDAGSVAAGSSATLALRATVDAGRAGNTFTNSAAITALVENETDTADNSASLSIRVPLVDLAVTKSVNDARPNELQQLVYTIRVSNLGPDYASMVEVSDVLPANMTYAGKSVSQGSYDQDTGKWTVGTVASGGHATLTLRASANVGTAGGPDIDNVASVSNVHEDEVDLANNSAVARIHVPLVDLSLAKVVAVPPDSSPNANEGDVVGFTVTVQNAGPDYASMVRIAEPLPSGFSLVSATPSAGSFGSSVWSIPQLNAGASATLAIQARAATGSGGRWWTNAVAVSAVHEKDSTPGNNNAAVQVYVELADLVVNITGELSDFPAKWSIPLSKDADYRLIVDSQKPSFHMWNVGQTFGTDVSKDWHYYVARYTRSTNATSGHDLEFYVDGQKVATQSTGGTPIPGDGPLFLGSYLGSNAFYGGAIDEVRLSKTARSPAWIETAYNQQSAPATFVVAGPERAGTLWSYEKTLTVQSARVAGDLVDFPVLVRLDDANLKQASAGGHVQSDGGWDICFTMPDGTLLKYEIERYAGNEGSLVAWVKVPQVSASADTPFFMHYGQAGLLAPANAAAQTWDADFVMVQHMDEESGVLADSTAFANDGTNAGARFVRFGVAGGAYAFDGVNDTVAIPHSPSLVLTTNDYTLEGWFSRRLVPADVQLRIVVRNNGPDPADDVELENRLSGLAYVSHFTRKGTFDGATGLWDMSRIAIGESATNWILADATVTGAVSSTVEVMLAEQADHTSAHGNHASGEDDQSSVTLRGPPEPPGRPDFVVSAITLNPEPPVRGGPFTATITVVNQGERSGNAGLLKLWANKADDALTGDVADRTVNIGTLAAGASTTITASGFAAPSADGTYTFRAFVDGAGATVEQSEGNNQKTATYTLASPGPGPTEHPDFEVTAIDLLPTSPAPGAPLTVSVTVVNKGLAAGNGGLLRVWINHPAAAGIGEASDASVAVGPLAIGQSQSFSFAGLTAPASGWCTFRAFADSTDATVEQSEGNNQKTVTYGVQAAATWMKPDFVVSEATLTASPTPGGAIGLTVVVLNQGDLAGNAGVLKVWANHAANAMPAEAADASIAIGTLAPGASWTNTIAGLTAPAVAGTYLVRAFADGADATVEKSEGNNQKTATYTLAVASGGGTPSWMKSDFEITAIDFSPAAFSAGGAFTAFVTVINKGDIAGDGGSLDVWLHSPGVQPAGAVGDAAVPVGALMVGESKVLAVPLTAPATPGWYTLRAHADSANTTAEKSEGNNQKTKTYHAP